MVWESYIALLKGQNCLIVKMFIPHGLSLWWPFVRISAGQSGFPALCSDQNIECPHFQTLVRIFDTFLTVVKSVYK